ncbi:hypothetical protein CFOL_v3_16755, partial [Cephalotus follicularis]
MMSSGSYGNGGGCSNLSASAPPFTVDRSFQKPNSSTPLLDLTHTHYAAPLNSSLHNWLGLDSAAASSFSSSCLSDYRCPPTAHFPQYAQASDAVTTNLSEAKPYYPPYVSPTVDDDDGPLPVPQQPPYDLLSTSHGATFSGSSHHHYTQCFSGGDLTASWGALWEPLPTCSWEQAKPTDDRSKADFDIAVSSHYNDHYMNQGVHASKGINTFEEASLSSDKLCWEKQVASADTDQLGDKSVVGELPKCTPYDFLRTSMLESTSLLPESYPREPSQRQTPVNSRNCQMPYSSSYEKCLRHHDSCLNDFRLVMKPSPTLVIRPPAGGTSSSVLSTGSIKDASIGSDAADKYATGNSSSTWKEPIPLPSPEGRIRFDASQLSFHTGRNDHIFSELSSTRNEEVSSNNVVSKDVLDQLFNPRSRLQVPRGNTDEFNLSLDCNEAYNPIQIASENMDHYIPAVDSPCWKGAPVSCISPFKASETIASQFSKNLEANSGSNFQGPQISPLYKTDDSLKVSSQKLNELNLEFSYLENGFQPSPKRPAVGNMLSREYLSNHAVSAGLYHKKRSGHVIQSSNDSGESKEEYDISDRSIDESGIKLSHTIQQHPEPGVATSENECASKTAVSDIEINVDDGSEGGSHVPFHAAEHVLCSPSEYDSPAKHIKPREVEPTPKINLQTLVKAMHNLSELLLFHCSNETCELKEEDSEALKNVLNNLHKCVIKNVGPLTSAQESFFPQQDTSQCCLELQIKKGAAVNVSRQPNYEHFLEKNKHHTVSSKEEEKSSDFVSVRGNADIVKYNNMTQSIKEILSEDLHDAEEVQPQNLLYKNLWLEAEAALCSINYMARFNRMKVEMEKCKSHKTDQRQFDDSICINTADMEKLSKSSSSDLNTVNKLDEAEPGSTLDIASMSNHADDVMAGLNVLRCRINNSNSVDSVDVEEFSSSKVDCMQYKVDKLEPEVRNDPSTDTSIWGSSVSNVACYADDVDASVMARFHILKCRAGKSSSVNVEGQALPKMVDVGLAGDIKKWPIIKEAADDTVLDINVKPVLQHHTANHAGENLTMKEFYLQVKEDPVIQCSRSNGLGDQIGAGWYDSSSSDWEHVLKEDLAGQN